jgi:hypothetical protein
MHRQRLRLTITIEFGLISVKTARSKAQFYPRKNAMTAKECPSAVDENNMLLMEWSMNGVMAFVT